MRKRNKHAVDHREARIVLTLAVASMMQYNVLKNSRTISYFLKSNLVGK